MEVDFITLTPLYSDIQAYTSLCLDPRNKTSQNSSKSEMCLPFLCLHFEPSDTAGENTSELWRWIYNAVTVTQSLKCFEIGTLWKKRNLILPPYAQTKKVDPLWPKHEVAHSARVAMTVVFSGLKRFLKIATLLSWANSGVYGHCGI